MIFTHIFRYFDDRDAEEIRRKNSDNSRPSPAADSRFHESSTEHRDAKFGQISWKAPSLVPGGKQTSTGYKTPSLAHGFSTLRADTRSSAPKPPTTTNSVLPPIGRTQMAGGEKQLVVNDKKPAKLPPIDQPLASKAQANARRPCSKNSKETFWKNATNTLEDHRRSRPHSRVAPLNSDKVTEKASLVTEEMTECLIKESKEDNWQTERRKAPRTFDDMSLAKAGIKKTFYQQNAKKLDCETTEVVAESTQTDAVNKEETSNNQISRFETTHKSFSDGEESRGNELNRSKQHDKKPKTGDSYNSLTLSEHNDETLTLSAGLKKENAKSRCYSTPCVQTYEASNTNNVNGSLVTNEKKKTQVHLVTCDMKRRNAICEVLEKRIVPEYGSSLYEMRQNLMSMS